LLLAFILYPIGLLIYLILLFRRPVPEHEYLGELTQRLKDTDPAVRAVAERRLRKLPHTEAVRSLLTSDEQAGLEAASKLEQLPDISIKKAIRIERNFAVWSTILVLWLFFGFFRIFTNFSDLNNYSTTLSALRNPFFEPKPEFAQFVARVKPHLSALENLYNYFLVVAIASIQIWIAIFPIRKRFIQRQQEGPTWLCLLLGAWIVIHAFGAFLTLSIPMKDTMGFVDVFEIRVMPFVFAVFALTLSPFFGRKAGVYYQWTAIDNTCFSKHGIGRKVLQRRHPESILALMNEPRWYHVVIAVMFPYAALPWGIVNLVCGKRRSGWVLVIVSLVVFIFILLIGLSTMLITKN